VYYGHGLYVGLRCGTIYSFELELRCREVVRIVSGLVVGPVSSAFVALFSHATKSQQLTVLGEV
jgi:hypothetical protein